MAKPTVPMAAAGHPSPHRDRASVAGLAFIVWAGPVAWIVQLLAGYALALYPCFPRAEARTSPLPGWDFDWSLLLAINIAAAILALAGAVLALRYWRGTRHEAPGSSHHAIEAGEGRTRFLALCGAMTGFGFLAAIAFDTVVLFTVPQCVG